MNVVGVDGEDEMTGDGLLGILIETEERKNERTAERKKTKETRLGMFRVRPRVVSFCAIDQDDLVKESRKEEMRR